MQFGLIFFSIILLFITITEAVIKPKHEIAPETVKTLMYYYPQILKFEDNKLYFKNGSVIQYDDGKKNKSQLERLNNPDIEDQFFFKYNKGAPLVGPAEGYDPGRIRSEAFLKAVYGSSQSEVRKNLTEVVWCPTLVNQKILITKVNGVDKKISAISMELDKMPQYKDYLMEIGGTFNWRYINGTRRLSAHSFGTTIDLNTKKSNYWQWECGCADEKQKIKYKNRIPKEIVDIFEKNGFIWGGRWYHYDTMHFEYRPELIK